MSEDSVRQEGVGQDGVKQDGVRQDDLAGPDESLTRKQRTRELLMRTRMQPLVRDAVQIGLIAGASAVLGGLAVAWLHRKTLEQLRTAPATPPMSGEELQGDE